MGIVMVAMLAFGGTFAYFTATATERTDAVKTGYIKLSTNDDFALVADGVLPGDTLISKAVTVTPSYTGSDGEFVAVKVTIKAEADNAEKTDVTAALKLGFTAATSGEGWYKLDGKEGVYFWGSNATTPVAMTEAKTVLEQLTIDTSVADDWKQENATNSESKLMNATVTVTISARGVQAAHVTDAVDQLKLLFA